jgi:NAD(P)-dependent dehydrogenase (short-subunit alcohol dehydrogenase family)
VLIHDQHSTADVEALVNPILSSGGVAKAIAADISTAEGTQQLAKEARGIVGDRLDILVLNVAAAASAPLLLIELLLPILNHGSSVIFMYPASRTSRLAATPAYRSQHETIEKQSSDLAAALRPRGVRVNAIEISRAPTSSRAAEHSRRASGGAADGRAGRRCEPSSDVGAAVTFLASNESGDTTGATVRFHFKTNTGRNRASVAIAPGERQP